MKSVRSFGTLFVLASLLFITPALVSAEKIDSGNKPFFASIKEVNGTRITAWVFDGRVQPPVPNGLSQSELREYLEDRDAGPLLQPVLVTVRADRKEARRTMLYPGRTIGIIGSYDAESLEIEADSIMGFSWSIGSIPRTN